MELIRSYRSVNFVQNVTPRVSSEQKLFCKISQINDADFLGIYFLCEISQKFLLLLILLTECKKVRYFRSKMFVKQFSHKVEILVTPRIVKHLDGIFLIR